jgi:hypothetical protein
MDDFFYFAKTHYMYTPTNQLFPLYHRVSEEAAPPAKLKEFLCFLPQSRGFSAAIIFLIAFEWSINTFLEDGFIVEVIHLKQYVDGV